MTKKNKPIHRLKDPFPLVKLPSFDFGSADGARDNLVEDTFVMTSSIKSFLENRHSIVIGPIGSGKSTLFRLLKEKSNKLESFDDCIIVPIEESISFHTLNNIAKEYFGSVPERVVFSIIWKFQISVKLAEKLTEFEDFPNSDEEKRLKSFLYKVNKSESRYKSVPEKLKDLVSSIPLKLEVTIGGVPAMVEAKTNKTTSQADALNIDLVLSDCEAAFSSRSRNGVLIAVDKIDKFVAGEEYETQRDYIASLLDVEDDLASKRKLNFKIFVRQDLYERLDFSRLGYDKVSDNTLRLEWSNDELIRFISNRTFAALEKVCELKAVDVYLSTNLEKYHLSGFNYLRLSFLPRWIKKKLFNFDLVNKERDTSLIAKLDRSVITKLYPRNIKHRNRDGEVEDISIFDFITTHFRDGHDVTTPRYLLIFIKEVLKKVISYYDNNPDQEAHVVEIDGDYEWELFKARSVYEGYIAAKEIYAKNIRNVDDKWKKNFVSFLSRKGNKTNFDFKWLRGHIEELDEQEAMSFLAYLQVIGYLKNIQKHPDIRFRNYELPILYRNPVIKDEKTGVESSKCE